MSDHTDSPPTGNAHANAVRRKVYRLLVALIGLTLMICGVAGVTKALRPAARQAGADPAQTPGPDDDFHKAFYRSTAMLLVGLALTRLGLPAVRAIGRPPADAPGADKPIAPAAPAAPAIRHGDASGLAMPPAGEFTTETTQVKSYEFTTTLTGAGGALRAGKPPPPELRAHFNQLRQALSAPDADGDTAVSFTVTDAVGHRRTYRSLAEMPPEVRAAFDQLSEWAET